MAYSTNNPPFLITQGVAGSVTDRGNKVWGYNSSDLMGTVAATGYFTNGFALGMRVGDRLLATAFSTATTPTYVGHGYGVVSASVASSAATVVFVSSST